MKKKILMTLIFILCLSTMLFPWFGKMQGMDDISGLILLKNPVAVTCIILTFIGIWTDFGKNSEIIGAIGLIGIIIMEIYEFLTWHILTITGHFDLNLSIHSSYPEFYLAILCTFITYIIYKHFYQKIDLTV